MGFSRHYVNHLYNVFRHVIGRWLSLAHSPGFGMKDVFPPENQRGYYWAPWVMAWNVLTSPSCCDRARFHQKFVILSGPSALQFHFILITFIAFSLSKMKVSSKKGAGTHWLIACSLLPTNLRTYSQCLSSPTVPSRSYLLLEYFQTYHFLLPGWESCSLVAHYLRLSLASHSYSHIPGPDLAWNHGFAILDSSCFIFMEYPFLSFLRADFFLSINSQVQKPKLFYIPLLQCFYSFSPSLLSFCFLLTSPIQL